MDSVYLILRAVLAILVVVVYFAKMKDKRSVAGARPTAERRSVSRLSKAIVTREDRWTQMHLAYRREGLHDRDFVAEELAAACLIFRDAAWAVGLYPWRSHGDLGVSESFKYTDLRLRLVRTVWLVVDESHRPTATYQDRFDSSAGRTEHLPDLEETTLRRLADWVRGRSS